MAIPQVVVVRETPSLADSVQLLLETVGFHVLAYDSPSKAFAHVREGGQGVPVAIVVACNRSSCETLRTYPGHLPPYLLPLPVIVVGRSVAVPNGTSPSNVRFVALPLQAKEFLAMLDRLASTHVSGPTHLPMLAY
jgi:FixJ family two-component response regulator